MRTLRLAPVLAVMLLSAAAVQAQPPLLIDSHNDVPYYTVQGRDIASASGSPHTSVASLKAGGVGGLFFSIWVAKEFVQGNRSANRALQLINSVRHDVVEKHPADFMLATSVKDIEEAHRQGKIAALMGIEGGHAIEDSVRLLDDFYDLGVRYMTLTHTNTNNWADSSGDITRTDVKHHDGLTPFGKDVVREMNRLGMLVDISHVSDKTFWDALEVSKAPIFASHSDARALANAPRNMTDEMIVALAKKGGIIDINFNCGFLSQRYRDELATKSSEVAARLKQETAGKNLGELETDQLEGKIIAELGIKPATLADVVEHIDHVRKIAGIDAIGIGTDFNGVECVPQGLEDVSKFPNLTRALQEKGYKEDDIRKIYSGNLLRVMRAAEVAAGK
ncbi:MAG TPA: dipeptidase [Bryobacteraceae bacterium]|jgi:membrane dipeptidase